MFFTLKKVSLVLVVASLLFTSSPMAQAVSNVSAEPILDHAWRQYEYPPDFFAAEESTNPRIFQEVDILHYTIDAKFFLGASYPDTAYLEAVTTIDGQAKAETLNELIIDFYDNITINSLKFNDTEFSNYTRSDNKIWMDLNSDPLDPSEFFEVTVDYTHVYGDAYQGLMFRTQGDEDATPAICSIDQPYRSPGWWPCFDYPSDKATADIYMTYPDSMTAVSNGSLQSEENNGDGTKTSHYREDYQAYTSALSVAMTDYVTWTDTYVSPLDGTTMPLEYYAFPADAAKAMIDYDVTGDAIVYFAQIYGEYPFINEKYGIAETPNRMGSLEHQTMTSLTYRATQSDVNWDVIVHELAHQWWGDWVTCETWNHVWLHEGFATYSEVLFHEYDTGEPAGPFMAVNYDDGEYDGDLGGTVYCEDHHLHNPFLETGALYEKGGWVLHMLRYIIGDDTSFFNAIKTFGIDHAHATAVTDDFKGFMEVAYDDNSLDDFFNQWLYTPYRPIYSVTYEISSREGGYKVDVNLRQTQTHPVQDIETNPLREHYIMPVEFTVHYMDETSDTFSFENTLRDQSFQILTTKEPDYTVFDEGVHILKIAEEQVADNDGVPGDGDNSGIPGDNFCNGATENCDDNCPDVQNGPEGGTCTAGATYKIGRPCLNDGDCEVGGFCSSNQEDTYPSGGDGIGDACFLCESNFDCDGDVDGTDAGKFKLDFGRSTFFNPCTNVEQCNGDFDCDSDCDGTDAAKFKEDFGRSGFSNPCPVCIVGDWCSYP